MNYFQEDALLTTSYEKILALHPILKGTKLMIPLCLAFMDSRKHTSSYQQMYRCEGKRLIAGGALSISIQGFEAFISLF